MLTINFLQFSLKKPTRQSFISTCINFNRNTYIYYFLQAQEILMGCLSKDYWYYGIIMLFDKDTENIMIIQVHIIHNQ